MKEENDFFIGWSNDVPRMDRRFMLAGTLALLAGGAAIGASLGSNAAAVGKGGWNMGAKVTLQGLLTTTPYPALRTRDLDGHVRTVFLATSGKMTPHFDHGMTDTVVSIVGTLLRRGDNAMLAVSRIGASSANVEPAAFAAPSPTDHGPIMLVGEILDAKCWFGAMRPGYGKTHKSCAALCARGGLPLAFCQLGDCGDGASAPLFLDPDGQAFGRRILPLVADPVSIQGRLIKVGDVMQIRAPFSDIRRI